MSPAAPAAEAQLALAALLDAGEIGAAQAHYAASTAAGLDLPFPARLIAALHAQGATAAAERLALTARFPGPAAPWQVLGRVQSLEWLGAHDAAHAQASAGVAQFPQAGNLRVALARQAFLSRQADAETVAACRVAAAAQPDQAALMGQIATLLETGRVTAMGFDLVLPPQAVSPRVAMAILSGGYEASERRAAIQGLRADDRVMELGSGIGLVALSLARARPGLPIMTVEANPELEQAIRANFAANGCPATLIGAVAALHDGTADFYLAEDFWASSTEARTAGANAGSGANARCLRRPTVDVNRLIAQFRPTLLVMDIEGGELALLPHLALAGLRRLVIEFHPAHSPAAAISACLAHLLAQGFVLDLGAGSQQVLVFDRPAPADCPAAAQPPAETGTP